MRLLNTIAKISPIANVCRGVALPVVDKTNRVDTDEYIVWNEATAMEGVARSVLPIVVLV